MRLSPPFTPLLFSLQFLGLAWGGKIELFSVLFCSFLVLLNNFYSNIYVSIFLVHMRLVFCLKAGDLWTIDLLIKIRVNYFSSGCSLAGPRPFFWSSLPTLPGGALETERTARGLLLVARGLGGGGWRGDSSRRPLDRRRDAADVLGATAQTIGTRRTRGDRGGAGDRLRLESAAAGARLFSNLQALAGNFLTSDNSSPVRFARVLPLISVGFGCS